MIVFRKTVYMNKLSVNQVTNFIYTKLNNANFTDISFAFVFRVAEDEAGQKMSANHSSVQRDAREPGVSDSTRLAAGWRPRSAIRTD